MGVNDKEIERLKQQIKDLRKEKKQMEKEFFAETTRLHLKIIKLIEADDLLKDEVSAIKNAKETLSKIKSVEAFQKHLDSGLMNEMFKLPLGAFATVKTAAREKGVSLNTIYRKIRGGEFHIIEIDDVTLILRDEKYNSYQPPQKQAAYKNNDILNKSTI